MKRTLRILLSLSLILLLTSLQKDILSGYHVPPSAQSVAIGDLDLNGFNDIVVGHNHNPSYGFGGISILKNQDWGYYLMTDSLYAYANEWDISVGQLDLNPKLEILYSKYNPTLDIDYICIAFNDDVEDTLDLTTTRNHAIECVKCGDIDDNSFNDIVFASNQGLFWGIFYNYGNRNFSAPVIYNTTNYYPSGLAVGDLNNDGRDDIVLCGQTVDVHLSYPAGFQNFQLSAGGFAGDVAIPDFDLDGYRDILVSSGFGSTQMLMYRNNHDNTFQQMPSFSFQPLCGDFVAADFNNDGLTDVMFQKNDETGYILWYNQGNFQLTDSTVITVTSAGEPRRSFECADLDNNAFNDLVIVRFNYYNMPYNVVLRFNNGQGQFISDPIVGCADPQLLPGTEITCYPNPFDVETAFKLNLAKESLINLSVYDISGKMIAVLADEKLNAGIYRFRWEPGSDNQNPVVPGTYLYSLKKDGIVTNTGIIIKL